MKPVLNFVRCACNCAQPLGVEISKEARDSIETQLGLPGYEDLSECLARTGPVDAVVLNDLVEHLVDPDQLLQAAVDGLREGGVISTWTPNGSAAGEHLGSAREWVGFRVDLEHLQYLSPTAIIVLARRMGLAVQHLETTGFPGLVGLERAPRAPSWLRTRFQQARTAASSSPIGRIARTFRQEVSRRRSLERTAGTYHLFAMAQRRT